MNSNTKEKKGKDNLAFEADEVDPDYPRATTTQITFSDKENTKMEKIQKSCQDAPYNFTSFKVYDETTQDRSSYPNADPYDKTRERAEHCRSASKITRTDSLEDKWQQVQWKDYGNSPSTSESPAAGPSNTPNDEDHSLISLEKSSDTDTSADKSTDEIEERVATEVLNSEDKSVSEIWFSVQYKNYSVAGTSSVVSLTDDNGDDESFGTIHVSDTSTLPTMHAPSVLLPADETPYEDTVSINQYESINDCDDHFVANGNKVDEQNVKENTTRDEVEGRNNTRLSKSLIGGEVKEKLPANSSTTMLVWTLLILQSPGAQNLKTSGN